MKAWKLCLGTITGLSAISIAASFYFFQFAIVRKQKNMVDTDNMAKGEEWERIISIIRKEKQWLKEQELEKVVIDSFDGLKLAGKLFLAEKPTNRIVLTVHGYTSSSENDFAGLCRFYHEMGYHILMVDDRAHGESEGEYIGFGCLDYKDCIEWIEYLNQRFGEMCHILLHGISMGATTVLLTSNQMLPKSVKGIVSDCAFTSAWDVFKHILKRDYHLPAFPIMHLTNKICEKKAGYSFREYSTLDAVKDAKVPILFIHGKKDDFVPVKMGKENYNNCTTQKELLLVEGAGHAASYYTDTRGYKQAVKKLIETCEF